MFVNSCRCFICFAFVLILKMKVEKLRKLAVLNDLLTLVLKSCKILYEIEKIDKKRKRSCHVRRVNRTRNLHGFYKTTFLEMKSHDAGQFFKFTRMNVHMFNSLLNLIRPEVETPQRKKSSSINAECRLSITLMYLAQGTPIQKIASSYKLGKETVRAIILETTHILWKTLYEFYVAEPKIQDYEQIESEFRTKWNFPNCIGAIDGRQIALKCPRNSGRQYFNYKNYHSIVLIAACDSKYRFTHVDIGACGLQNDAGIFENSALGQKIINGTSEFPSHKRLPKSDIVLPHFFVGDAAFPLGLHLMRPYAGKSLPHSKEYFNKRLSRARRTIENAFGILVARWRILLQTINMNPDNAEKVVLACVSLHNFIMLNNDISTTDYVHVNYVDREDNEGVLHEGLWRSEVETMLPQIQASNKMTHGGQTSTAMRNKLRDYILNN